MELVTNLYTKIRHRIPGNIIISDLFAIPICPPDNGGYLLKKVIRGI